MRIRSLRLAWPLVAALACMHAARAQEAAWEARAFWQRLDVALESVTPPAVDEIVPGFDPDATPTPGLVVADLENGAGTAGDWGKVVGQILRWDLAYAYSPGLQVPDSYTFYRDALVPGLARAEIGRDDRSVKRAAQRLGLAHALTGQIAVHDEAFELELALRDLEAGGVVESFRFGGALAQLPGVLDDLPARILAALNVSHPTPRETRAAQAGIPELRALVTALSLPADATRAAQADAVRKLWSSGPRSVLAAAHYLGHVEAPDPSTYLARLDAVRAEFAQDRGLDWLVARMMPARDGLLEEKKRRIAAHVLERPGDPMPMVVLADTLVDNGYALGGVSLMREALLRWPRNYRAWWSTSYASVHYGWELRGTSFWRDVPEPAQRLFPLLREAADRAVDQALARHQELPELWVQKMMTVGQFGEEFMQAYRRAIELDPQNRRAYEMALNYTLPQWGGSREIQDEIWAQARERIHDPAWLEEMQARYRSDESLAQRLEDRAAAALGSFLRPGLALALLAVLALVAALLWVLLRGRAG